MSARLPIPAQPKSKVKSRKPDVLDQQIDDVGDFCTECGHCMGPNAKYCSACGTKKEQTAEIPLGEDVPEEEAVDASEDFAAECIDVLSSDDDNVATSSNRTAEQGEDSSGPCAFVAVLFGPKASYCIDALVLGECLRAVGTEHPYILLHTSDVPQDWHLLLQKVGWELREVEYLNGDHLYNGGSQGRFAGVFTKLRALSLFEFNKIVLLDTDLLVRTRVDDLFQRPVPSGMRRHASADYIDRARIPSHAFVDHRDRLISGINAGVMVLKPCATEFETMCDQLSSGNAPDHQKSGMPEQDYLTRFYAGSWHHLSVAYNFQPHQLAFTDRRGLEKCHRLTMNYEDVKIVHFSSGTKPRDFLIDMAYEDMEEMQFAEEVLLKLHMEGFYRDRRSRYSSHSPFAIDAQLRAATRVSAGEWFQRWNDLKLKFPELEFMVETTRVLAEVPRAPRWRRRKRDDGNSRSRSRGH